MVHETPRVLLVDDEASMCRMLDAVMTDHGFQVTSHTDPKTALAAFEGGRFDVVISDVKMPGMDGLQVLEHLRNLDAGIPVIMISGHATVEMSIQALRRGAYDMLVKPFEPEELLGRVRNALRQSELVEENRALKNELEARFGAMVGSSPALLPVLETARKVAARDIPVLITGESGTGKELLAQAIHQHSTRRGRRFVAINCGAIPGALLESELFGHRKGAFTGADRDHEGLVTAANGGTLFLDEIGTLPINVQTALLRFLQEQEFYRVGDTTPRKVDVRVVSATNLDTQNAIRSGELREDLFYRLAVVRLHLPPLRERKEDVPLLAAHFVQRFNQQFRTSFQGFTAEATGLLCGFDWPGNIRQLSNVVQASMAMESGDRIGVDVLGKVMGVSPGRLSAPSTGTGTYTEAMNRFEMDYFRGILEKAGGVVEMAAEASGVNPATIYRKLKKYNLKQPTPMAR